MTVVCSIWCQYYRFDLIYTSIYELQCLALFFQVHQSTLNDLCLIRQFMASGHGNEKSKIFISPNSFSVLASLYRWNQWWCIYLILNHHTNICTKICYLLIIHHHLFTKKILLTLQHLITLWRSPDQINLTVNTQVIIDKPYKNSGRIVWSHSKTLLPLTLIGQM